VSRAERVAIVGGGVSGALSAARLAERGFDVTLLEKAAIGNGSSSRSMAGIRAQFGVAETVIGMLFSEWWYAHFHEMLDTPPEHQQPAIRQNGYLFLYDHPDAPDAAPDAAANWAHTQRQAAMQQRARGRQQCSSAPASRSSCSSPRISGCAGRTW
jgi:glycine/D-amino acid oxidase-like deaminating enzyme